MLTMIYLCEDSVSWQAFHDQPIITNPFLKVMKIFT